MAFQQAPTNNTSTANTTGTTLPPILDFTIVSREEANQTASSSAAVGGGIANTHAAALGRVGGGVASPSNSTDSSTAPRRLGIKPLDAGRVGNTATSASDGGSQEEEEYYTGDENENTHTDMSTARSEDEDGDEDDEANDDYSRDHRRGSSGRRRRSRTRRGGGNGTLCASARKCFTPWCCGIRPSITVLTALLWVIALVCVVVAITVTSERLYTGTIDKFGRNAVETAVQRGSQIVVQAYQDAIATPVGMQQAIASGGRLLPTVEESLMRNLSIPVLTNPPANLNPTPSIGSRGYYDQWRYDWHDRVVNSTVNVSLASTGILYSTWRQYFTTLLSTNSADGSGTRISSAEIIFKDGAMIRAEALSALNTLKITDRIPIAGIPATPDGNLTYLERTYNIYVLGSFASNPFPIYSRNVSRKDDRLKTWYTDPLQEFDAATGNRAGLGFRTTVLPPTRIISATTGFLSEAILPIVSEISSSGDVIGRLRVEAPMVDSQQLLLTFMLRGYLKELYSNNAAGTEDSAAFLVDSVSDVVLQTTADTYGELWSDTPIPAGHIMTAEERQRGCFIYPSNPLLMTCRPYVRDYKGSSILRAAYAQVDEDNRNSSDLTSYKSPVGMRGAAYLTDVKFHTLIYNNYEYYVGSTFFQVSVNQPRLHLLFVVPIGNLDIIFSEVRRTVIVIAACVAVGFAVFLLIASRLVMHPIHIIAARMTIAASLQEIQREIHLSGWADERLLSKVARRNPSMWSEVYAIQASYWALTDELQALKAYIPEHLREDIFERYRSGDPVAPLADGPSSPQSQTHGDCGGEETPAVDELGVGIELAEVKFDDIRLQQTPPIPPQQLHQLQQQQQQPPVGINTTNITVGAPIPLPLDSPDSSPMHPNKSNSASHLNLPYSGNSSTSETRPVYFVDSSLIDRRITMVHININGFHDYILRRRHPMTIGEDYSKFITYIHGEVRRFGGVLESFSGDKLWVSFNATNKCTHHEVAAAYFAFSVTTTINGTALRYQREDKRAPRDEERRRELPEIDPRFWCCKRGVSCGVSTGHALVGPVGNRVIKRHNIISNAMPEATALERLARNYSGCNVLITTEMMAAVDGYFQYLVIDASLLPGSRGNRKHIAALKGPMLAPSANIGVVRNWVVAAAESATPNTDVEKQVVPSTRGTLTSCFDFHVERPYVNRPSADGGLVMMRPPPDPLTLILPLYTKYAVCIAAVDVAFTGHHDQLLTLTSQMEQALHDGPDPRYGETAEEYRERCGCIVSTHRLLPLILASPSTFASELGVSYGVSDPQLESVKFP